MKQQVAIQGIKGSFHHQVAQEYFGHEVDTVPCTSFTNLVNELTAGKVANGVMAIENSIAGSILPNYALINDHKLQIRGEHYLPINMNLMALPGQDILEITEVRSHPIALLQVKEFFKKYPHIKLVEDNDTAEVAMQISEQKLKGVAAVASTSAANLFKLETLAKEIHTVKNNATRFLILSNATTDTELEGSDKASIKFELDQQHGNLASVLNILNDCNLQLTKIQSLPIIESPWKYSYFIDVTYSAYTEFLKAIEILKVITQQLKVLGNYKNSRI